MMKRRDFISLINAIWLFTTGLFLSQKKQKVSSYVQSDSTSAQIETYQSVVLESAEKFVLPVNPTEGFSLKIVIDQDKLQKQPAIVVAESHQSIEGQTQEIEMDVAGVYLFTFIQANSFWAVQKQEEQTILA